MSLARLGVLIGLDLRQRVRRTGFYVLLGVFFLVVMGITWLSSLVFAGTGGAGAGMISVAIYAVLLMATLVTPTFTGNAINGERESATLAPVQVTAARTSEILLSKLVAGWITGLVFLVAALPAFVWAFVQSATVPPDFAYVGGDGGAPSVGTLLVALLVLIVEVGVFSAIGVGLSAVIAKPLFSVASTYLVIALLTIGTLIVFGLGTFAVRTPSSTLTESPDQVVWGMDDYVVPPSCDDAPAGEPCTEPRPDITPTCVEVRNTGEEVRTDRVWWALAANPFVVLADATPTQYDEWGYPTDLFGQIKYGVRAAQQAPDLVRDDWEDPCDGLPSSDEGAYDVGSDTPTGQELIEQSVPSWFVGLGIQIVLAAGLMGWGAARTRTPATKTPPGSRVA